MGPSVHLLTVLLPAWVTCHVFPVHLYFWYWFSQWRELFGGIKIKQKTTYDYVRAGKFSLLLLTHSVPWHGGCLLWGLFKTSKSWCVPVLREKGLGINCFPTPGIVSFVFVRTNSFPALPYSPPPFLFFFITLQRSQQQRLALGSICNGEPVIVRFPAVFMVGIRGGSLVLPVYSCHSFFFFFFWSM